VDDQLAGMDGWCRECKKLVVIPGGSDTRQVAELSTEEHLARLQAVFATVSSKAEEYRLRTQQYEKDNITLFQKLQAERAAALRMKENVAQEDERVALDRKIKSLETQVVEQQREIELLNDRLEREIAARLDAEATADRMQFQLPSSEYHPTPFGS